jgi:hypothetical protein
MPAPQLLLLAIAAMLGLASLRLARVHFGREPHPEHMRLFLLAFVLVPPIALGALIQPGPERLGGIAWVPLYAVMLAGLAVLMGIATLIVERVVPGRSRPVLKLALVGSQGDPDDVPFDPPVTARLGESVAIVDRANAVFPRGSDFPAQVDRAGFRYAWDTLDAATATLESRIAEDRALGTAVASTVTATARDARSRLTTLRGLAVDRGPAWAS